MATVPNQKIIKIHRDMPAEKEGNFLLIKKNNWFAANKDLEPYGLQVYLYLAGNKDGFNLELSQEAAEKEAGIKKTTFHKYVNLLIEKRYLVQRKQDSNIYDFYEIPQEKKIKRAETAGEQSSLQDEHNKENSNSDDELISLLCEFDDLQDNQKSSQHSKEIYNNTNILTDKKINNDEFIF